MPYVRDDWTGEERWEDEIDYSTRPDLAPPGAVWDPDESNTTPGMYAGDWFVPPDPGAPPPPTLGPAGPTPAPPPPGPGGPQQQQFNSPSFNDQRPGLPNRGNFKSPNPLAPWTEQFAAPTLQEATDTPGFQFRLGEGLKALQRSAAAKGTLLTGGTMKGLMDFGQDLASEEYGNVYNRKQGEYEGRRTNFLTNEANRYNSERGNMNDQWGIESSYFDMGRANRMDDFGIFDSGRKFDYNVFDSGRNFGRLLNQDYWGRRMDLSDLDLRSQELNER